MYKYIYINTELLDGNQGHQEETRRPHIGEAYSNVDLMKAMYARYLSWAGHFLRFLLIEPRVEAALPMIEEIFGNQLRPFEIRTPKYLISLTKENTCLHKV